MKEILEYLKKNKNVTYGLAKTVEKYLNEVIAVENDLSKVIKLYKKYIELRNKNKEALKNCHSDFCYWGLVGNDEEYQVVIEYIELLFYKTFNDNGSVFLRRCQDDKDLLTRVSRHANKTIDGLREFKPTQYKAKIELIEKLFDEDKD